MLINPTSKPHRAKKDQSLNNDELLALQLQQEYDNESKSHNLLFPVTFSKGNRVNRTVSDRYYWEQLLHEHLEEAERKFSNYRKPPMVPTEKEWQWMLPSVKKKIEEAIKNWERTGKQQNLSHFISRKGGHALEYIIMYIHDWTELEVNKENVVNYLNESNLYGNEYVNLIEDILNSMQSLGVMVAEMDQAGLPWRAKRSADYMHAAKKLRGKEWFEQRCWEKRYPRIVLQPEEEESKEEGEREWAVVHAYPVNGGTRKKTLIDRKAIKKYRR